MGLSYLKLSTSLQMISGTVSSFTFATVESLFSLFAVVAAVETPPSDNVGCDVAALEVADVEVENNEEPKK